jgi:integrase
MTLPANPTEARKVLQAIRPVKGPMQSMADAAMPGLSVIWGARGRPAWSLAYYTQDGVQHRQKLGFAWSGPKDKEPTPEWLSIEAARAKAYEVKTAARTGSVMTEITPKKVVRPSVTLRTLGQVVELYLDDPNTLTLKSRSEIERAMRKDLLPLWEKTFTKVDKPDIRAVLDRFGATIMGNRMHGYLTTFWRWAIDQDHTTSSPVPLRRPLTKEPTREHTLTDDEIRTLWKVTGERPCAQRDIVRLLILSGQRREEIAGMRWDEIDLDKKVWSTKSRSKTGAVLEIPLTEAMWSIINDRPRGSPYVFTSSKTGRRSTDMSKEGEILQSLTPSFRRGDNDTSWRLHDLRRTCDTGMAALKVKQETIDLLHHPMRGVKGVYNRHAYLSEKLAALELWGSHVASLILSP